MRVLHVIQCGPKGGAPLMVQSLAVRQVTKHEVGVVCEEGSYLAEQLPRLGITTWTLRTKRSIRPVRDAVALVRLFKIVKAFRPDVIHAHSSKAGVLARLVIVLLRIPVVYSPHNYAYRAYEAGRLVRGMFYAVELALAPLAAAVHFTCSHEFVDAKRMRTASRRRSVVVNNGIELHELEGVPPPNNQYPTIGAYARLCPQKRLDLFLRAFAEARRNHPEARALIIGNGPLRGELENLAETLGVVGAVTFTEDPGGPVAALVEIDIFVLSSSTETYPLAVMEALATGRAVVATTVGGLPEMATHHETALLVPPGDTDALAGALELLLSDKSLRARLSNAARLDARKRFSASVMNEGIEAIYERVVRPADVGGSAVGAGLGLS